MKTTKIFLLALLAFASVECFSQNYGEEYLERLCFPSAFSTCRDLFSSESACLANGNGLIRPVMNAGDTIVEITLVIPLQDWQALLSSVICLHIVIHLCLSD